MFGNYLKTAVRNLLRTTTYSLINVLGLSVGVAACLLILHYIRYETSYDKHHPAAERLYRLRYERSDAEGGFVRFASACPPAGPALKAAFPEIEQIARMYQNKAVISRHEIKLLEERIFYAEPEILDILAFQILDGDPRQVITSANTAIISRSLAQKFFADENPVGQQLTLDKKDVYQITGVFADLPSNSHLACEMLLSYPNLITAKGPQLQEAWGHTGFYTYLRLRPGANPADLEVRFPALIEQHAPFFKDYGLTAYLILQPVRDIHLTSHFLQELKPNGDRDTVRYLFIIAIFIVVMACVNYINLATARALTRAREVGIRKAIGAQRRDLIWQFLAETFVVTTLALTLAVGLVESTLGWFHRLVQLPSGLGLLKQMNFWVNIGCLYGAGILTAGLYPALLLSSFKPIAMLRGKFGASPRKVGLRRILVLFQFVIALLLIIATLAVFRQVDFMRDQKLGFTIDQTLVVRVPRVVSGAPESMFEAFKNEALRINGIAKTAFVTEVPGRQIFWDHGGIIRKGADDSESRNYMILGVDYDFVGFFELDFVEGRNFSREFPTDKMGLLMNERAVEWMGFGSPQEAVGQEVDYWGNIYTILGVLKNYHQQSPKDQFEPQLYRLMPMLTFGQFVLKIHTGAVRETIRAVEKLYTSLFPDNPFEYFFLDEYYNQQYQADRQFGKVVGLFSVLAIFVTCLGIFGLSVFNALQKTKEISIRKVLGADVAAIIAFLSRDFFRLLLVSFVIACPLAIYILRLWLRQFVMRMTLSGILFVLPLLIVGMIVLLTIAVQTLRAALSNPVTALRNE